MDPSSINHQLSGGAQLPQQIRMGSYAATMNQNIPGGVNVNFNQPTAIHSNGAYIGVNDGSSNYSTEYYTHVQAAARTSYAQQQDAAAHNRPRKLKVDDALSYLDQVRQQFAENPDVYNDFLEVMKEFKSHTIDTQGVIRRVSRLFSGHPNLITGFNTFLPPGYEVRVCGANIRIIEPSGEATVVNNVVCSDASVTVQNSAVLHSMESERLQQHQSQQQHQQVIVVPAESIPSSHHHHHADPIHHQHQVLSANSSLTSNAAGGLIGGGGVDAAAAAAAAQFTQDVKQFTEFSSMNFVLSGGGTSGSDSEMAVGGPSASSNIVVASAVAAEHTAPQSRAAIGSGAANSGGGNDASVSLSAPTQPVAASGPAAQPIHFDQAVGYLNKIKERFANRPEIYREFLNILGNYQKITSEQGNKLSMTETEVYQAVAQLFRDEEDLMRDFKSFLPDASLENNSEHKELSSAVSQAVSSSSEKADAENVQPPLSASNNKADLNKLKKRHSDSAAQATLSKKPKMLTKIGYDISVDKCLEDIPLKDFVFFERIHKALRNEGVVKNFFRCLMLYNKSLVSRHELVELATPFLAENPDLIKQFNEILGTGGSNSLMSPNKLEKLEHRLPSDLALQIDYSTCKRLGVSYRSLPDSFERSKCSGRTKLCNSVLNDTWVSFPSWSSESTESVSSKKSVFEDFMYRTEDERFEVDILIEVNAAAISALELVRRKIDAMKPDDAQKLKLDNNYGCNSPTLMGRAVKKLYGEHATKVLEGLRENPVVAVPQVLKRLREKDTEWRSVREEFNSIWRDQIDKNYLKSLDHQAITFKANDLKFLRSKAIIQQLESFYDERQSRIEKGEPVEGGPHMILEYPEDVSVMHDVNELLIHHVKRQQNIPKKEKFMIKKLLRVGLIPRLFRLEVENMSDDEEENDNNDKNFDEDQQITTRRTRRLMELKMSNNKKVQEIDPKPDNSRYALLFSTNCWLIFIRLHHIICERLARLKRRADELLREYELERQIRDCQEKVFQKHHRSLLSHQHNAVDVHLGLRELKKPLQNPEHFYATLMHELKNLLDGIIDSSTFEDTLRNMFGTDAYIMFTMDKLIATITRQLQHFVTDEASINSVNLFQKYCSHRARGSTSTSLPQPPNYVLDEQYEAAAEKVITSQNCYKMFFMHLLRPTLSVELINTDADEDDEDDGGGGGDTSSSTMVQLSKWSEYVEKYANDENATSTAEGQIEVKEPFLVRNVVPRKMLAEALFDPFSRRCGEFSTFYTNEGLRAVLSCKNLRLLYESGTSDVIIKRGAPAIAKKTLRETFERRRARFNKWLASTARRSSIRPKAAFSSSRVDSNEDTECAADFGWFTNNCRTVLYRNRDFGYLTYLRYFSCAKSAGSGSNDSNSSRGGTSSNGSSSNTTSVQSSSADM